MRPYADNDWEAVKTIFNLSRPDELKNSVDLRAIVPLEHDTDKIKLFHDSVIHVVEEDRLILGFGGHKNNYISWLYVHPDHRRKGIAGKILQRIIQGLSGTIRLNVAKNNKAAKSLYKAMGFKIEREFSGEYNGYKTRAMTLFLEKPE